MSAKSYKVPVKLSVWDIVPGDTKPSLLLTGDEKGALHTDHVLTGHVEMEKIELYSILKSQIDEGKKVLFLMELAG